MARIHDLIRQIAAQSPELARDIEREVAVLSERRAFGLNFERHTPEEVELPGRPVRRGDKVHVLPLRGEPPKAENAVMWVAESINRDDDSATIVRVDAKDTTESRDVALADLVVVAEFRDPVYPGLVSTGTVERGGDKPFHSVINGENFHALQTLLFTHRSKVDAIYIDPPYNTGARDWKYNNDYVESDDMYRHSKWLAFMERRLLLAKELLNPEDSVLIVTIDEKEYLRLGLLLEQMFPDARQSMVSTVISPFGVARTGQFSRVDEYIFILSLGSNAPIATSLQTLEVGESDSEDVEEDETADSSRSSAFASRKETYWFSFMRAGSNSSRAHSPGCFYPIHISETDASVHSLGPVLERGLSPEGYDAPPGTYAAWPINENGEEAVWQGSLDMARQLLSGGFIRTGRFNNKIGRHSVTYVREGTIKAIAAGELVFDGGDIRPGALRPRSFVGKSVWNIRSHNATSQGTKALGRILPRRKFPYPKSLYAVEDVLRFFVGEKPEATIVDFFAGSGTTAHAVMRINRQDGGRRLSISVTNNEVSADEQRGLRVQGLRPGEPKWEEWGICDYITKPRIRAAIEGTTPDGQPIQGDYKFNEIFPVAQGLDENVEFFTLTYEEPLRVTSNRDFHKVAPLLWLRAGSTGRRIDSIESGWEVGDTYGVLADLDKAWEFVTAVVAAPAVSVAFIISDEDRLFESVVRDLPEHVEPVRMYDAYLRNFELESRVPR